ncbi:MAG: hypothetical protein KatS3mg076_2259 [Candidatus Binatia bacterium]|nr:MAG: hypothetical protein KatS3mg076_2259 [Candidatus Binatia bacterium]
MKDFFAAVCLALFLPASSPAVVLRDGQVVMGTVFEATVEADSPETARRALREAVEEVRRWDRVLTTFRPSGELARLNARAGAGWTPASRALEEALRSALSFWAETGGIFDVAATETAEPVALPSLLRIRPGEVLLRTGARLDFGGMGKGLALDAAARRVRASGIESALLDLGTSTILAVGSRDWLVAVSGEEEGSLLGCVRLRGEALSVSRSGPGSAIVDPRSGRRVEERRRAVVLARQAVAADVWSTALVILGREGLARARRAGVRAWIADSEGNAGTDSFAGFRACAGPSGRSGAPGGRKAHAERKDEPAGTRR